MRDLWCSSSNVRLGLVVIARRRWKLGYRTITRRSFTVSDPPAASQACSDARKLRAGMSVTVVEAGARAARPVLWVGQRRARDATVICFCPRSLPIGPDRDLYVSPDHAMFVDGCLVPAELLVNGGSVVAEHRAA